MSHRIASVFHFVADAIFSARMGMIVSIAMGVVAASECNHFALRLIAWVLAIWVFDEFLCYGYTKKGKP